MDSPFEFFRRIHSSPTTSVDNTMRYQTMDLSGHDQTISTRTAIESIASPSKGERISNHSSTTSASASQSSSRSGETNGTAASGRLPDFFGNDVFRKVLRNPTTAHQLLLFSKSRLCGENMEYLEKVQNYHNLLKQLAQTLTELDREFLSPQGQREINISHAELLHTRKDIQQTLSLSLPKLKPIFDGSSAEIEKLVATDIYPRFVRHQLVSSASKALARDRTKYAGLGDCFVLTDPARADNPIVFSSDGFVRVTGYTRPEIIPRNCRFLQGQASTQKSVRRLKRAIDGRQESVELLLNYKKNGEPFWNQLYVTPLYDEQGRLAFFLGGQINCSTTIHNASDILRVLSYCQDEEDIPAQDDKHGNATAIGSDHDSNNFFERFRRQKSTSPPSRIAGMENGLLSRMENLRLKDQINEFYTAYSKFIIVNTSTNCIAFHSHGIMTLLYSSKTLKATPMPGSTPTNLTNMHSLRSMKSSPALHDHHTSGNESVTGQDIFKFLTQHAMNSLPWEFKSTIKKAMKAGQAVSLDLTLCTQRRMGFENFVTHWTPLKDEVGKIEYVVLTLGSLD